MRYRYHELQLNNQPARPNPRGVEEKAPKYVKVAFYILWWNNPHCSFLHFLSFLSSFFLSFIFSNFPSSFLPFRTKGPYERTTGLDREQSLFFSDFVIEVHARATVEWHEGGISRRPFSLALVVVSLFPCLSRLAPSVTQVVIRVSLAFRSKD